MTERERHAPEGLTATLSAPQPPGGPHAAAPPARTGPATSPGPAGPARASLWEDFYRSASPAQQQELLSLAGRQGLLYAHQLPQSTNGVRPQPADDARHLQVLSQLLQGKTDDLPPAPVEAAEAFDGALDGRQREAVARALGTPDVCLIQGLAGTGKSRVAAEIVTRAAARGDRVLLLAPRPAAIDRVLELVAGRDVLCSLRLLGREEQPERLPAAAHAATLAERARAVREDSLAAARRACEQAEQRCLRLRQQEALWPRLRELGESGQRLCGRLDELRLDAQQVGAQVEAEAERADADVPAELAEARRARQDKLAAVDAAAAAAKQEQQERQKELAALEGEVAALQPMHQAKQRGRWWSPAWWKATFKGDVAARLGNLQARLHQLGDALASLGQRLEALDRERRLAEEAYRQQQAAWVAAETERRRAGLQARQAALEQELVSLRQEWEGICASLADEALRPRDFSAEAIHASLELWTIRKGEDEQRCALAHQWAAYLEDSAASVAARLPGYANLVAATLTGLAGSEHFGDPGASGGQFDVLVLEEANLLSEPELLRAARRARRWVLIGEPTPEDPFGGEGDSTRTRGLQRMRPPASTAPRLLAFERLWQALHGDPSRLPYAWAHEGERLCCRLRQVAEPQRQYLESECVADSPEIELRILALPRVQPVLAEVLFPPSMGFAEARAYIYRELQELPVQAAQRGLHWTEEPDRLALCFSEPQTQRPRRVPLEQGVSELVDCAGEDDSAPPWHTCRIEFERAAGWDRGRAARWVQAHLNLRDLGRTAFLGTIYRAAPDLGGVLLDLLFDGAGRVQPCPRPAADGRPRCAMEFVPVPALGQRQEAGAPRDPERRRQGARSVAVRAGAAALPRAGAGLEQDLAAPRQGDRLPAEVRRALPGRGIVNYPEAQAVVRKLEELLGDGKSCGGSVAVIALYTAQAELIRQLVGQSRALAGAAPLIEVGVAAGFCHREYPVVLVSLTRSHSHRAVPLGEEPRHLEVALTRARDRLILLGDPGTLLRRSQWDGGPLDHLDEAATRREGRLAARLVGYLQGQGPHARAVRLCEGNCS